MRRLCHKCRNEFDVLSESLSASRRLGFLITSRRPSLNTRRFCGLCFPVELIDHEARTASDSTVDDSGKSTVREVDSTPLVQ